MIINKGIKGPRVYKLTIPKLKGTYKLFEAYNFDDTAWPVVNLPNGIEYLPDEASGGANYQGEIWYRKHYTPDAQLKGKKLWQI